MEDRLPLGCIGREAPYLVEAVKPPVRDQSFAGVDCSSSVAAWGYRHANGIVITAA